MSQRKFNNISKKDLLYAISILSQFFNIDPGLIPNALALISDGEKIDTKDLKVGDKVWIEVDVDILYRVDNIFWFKGTPFYFSQIKKIMPKI